MAAVRSAPNAMATAGLTLGEQPVMPAKLRPNVQNVTEAVGSRFQDKEK